jgi:hypothetical protein
MAADDIPWSPRNTWVVIGISGGLLILILTGTVLYEAVYKPDSFEQKNGRCVPVRGGSFVSMEHCLETV